MSVSREISKARCVGSNKNFYANPDKVCKRIVQLMSDDDLQTNYFANCVPPGYENQVYNPGGIKFTSYDYIGYSHINRGRGWDSYKYDWNYYKN
ncbi:MAG TPA: hypothetical protein VLE02_01680 [Nitrosarchaeum sp.]|nr:hypothetical protein [Nitrosarchaeum sp.]